MRADDDPGYKKSDQRRSTESVCQGDDRDGEADKQQEVTEQSEFWHRHRGSLQAGLAMYLAPAIPAALAVHDDDNEVSLPFTHPASPQLSFFALRRQDLSMMSALLASLRSAFKTRRGLALENLALRQQLAVLQQSVTRPRLSHRDRLVLGGVAAALGGVGARKRVFVAALAIVPAEGA